jgi:phage baseplate assembly protein W
VQSARIVDLVDELRQAVDDLLETPVTGEMEPFGL